MDISEFQFLMIVVAIIAIVIVATTGIMKIWFLDRYDGNIIIDSSGPTDIYRIEFLSNPDEWKKKKSVNLAIKKGYVGRNSIYIGDINELDSLNV